MFKRCLATIVVCAAASSVFAADFCIYSKLHIDKDVIESTTVFQAGRAYDFLDNPREVTVFDAPGNKFVVLDPERKVRTEVTLEQIEAFTNNLKSETMKRSIVPLLAFLAEPKFAEEFDPTKQELTLTSEWLTYRVQATTPKLPDAADIYADFINWQTKLNTMLRPGSLPPFARLQLNSALDSRGLMPTEVTATRHSPKGSRKDVTLRAEHRLQWRILSAEQDRLNEAATWLATFEQVNLREYQKPYLPKPAAEAGE